MDATLLYLRPFPIGFASPHSENMTMLELVSSRKTGGKIIIDSKFQVLPKFLIYLLTLHNTLVPVGRLIAVLFVFRYRAWLSDSLTSSTNTLIPQGTLRPPPVLFDSR